jgi:hypothetical protein
MLRDVRSMGIMGDGIGRSVLRADPAFFGVVVGMERELM